MWQPLSKYRRVDAKISSPIHRKFDVARDPGQDKVGNHIVGIVNTNEARKGFIL